MGMLDDAIKDHLELKRRHGADPGEVARLEHEALGPARREPAAAAAAPPPPRPEPVYDREDEDEVPASERLEAPVHDAPVNRIPEFHPERSEPPTPPPSVEQPTRQFSAEELEDAAQEPPRRAEPDQSREQPEQRKRPEPQDDVVPADEEPEDVLEETPEFLQETPEHDRLWFEQKPPKDFDF